MHLHLTLSQLTLLAGTALAVALVLALLFYLLHKTVKDQRSGTEFRSHSPRTENETAFVAAAVQGVIADLKATQKDLDARLRGAEKQARIGQRSLEAVAREIREALIVIGRDGYIRRANAAARELLTVDFLSKRLYGEILGRDSPLSALIQECIESGRPAKQLLTVGAGVGSATLEVSVAPTEDSAGTIESVVCLLRPYSASAPAPAKPSGSESNS
jgi:PAS domain-containing protein